MNAADDHVQVFNRSGCASGPDRYRASTPARQRRGVGRTRGDGFPFSPRAPLECPRMPHGPVVQLDRTAAS